MARDAGGAMMGRWRVVGRRRGLAGSVTTISNTTADAYVKRPPRETHLFLVHGTDDGLIHERAKGLVEATL
ncbi:MAG: hypothetical protein ABR878_16460, partial [Roseiarcus sp.]